MVNQLNDLKPVVKDQFITFIVLDRYLVKNLSPHQVLDYEIYVHHADIDKCLYLDWQASLPWLFLILMQQGILTLHTTKTNVN